MKLDQFVENHPGKLCVGPNKALVLYQVAKQFQRQGLFVLSTWSAINGCQFTLNAIDDSRVAFDMAEVVFDSVNLELQQFPVNCGFAHPLLGANYNLSVGWLTGPWPREPRHPACCQGQVQILVQPDNAQKTTMDWLRLRQVGIRAPACYPHLQPRFGYEEDDIDLNLFAPELRRFLQQNGYIVGPTLFCLHYMAMPEELDCVDEIPVHLECFYCPNRGTRVCSECHLLFCNECWHSEELEPVDCAGCFFCCYQAEFTCAAGHSLCEHHLDHCQVCNGHLQVGHTTQHHGRAIADECVCGAQAVQVCLGCGVCACASCVKDQCQCPAEQWVPVEQWLWQDFGPLTDWQPFAKAMLLPTTFNVDPHPNRREHLDTSWEVCTEILDQVSDLKRQLLDFEENEEEELIDLDELEIPVPEIELDSESVEFMDFALTDADPDNPGGPLTLGSGSLETEFDMQHMVETLSEMLDKTLISECQLISNCNADSPFYGHIAMICHYWPNSQYTLHRVARSVQELLELMDAAHAANAFFPKWFLETRRPMLAG